MNEFGDFRVRASFEVPLLFHVWFCFIFACGSDPYDSMDFLGVLMCGFDVVSSRGFEILIYLTGLRFGCFRGFY